MSSSTRTTPGAVAPTAEEPRADAISAALEQARASRRELHELRRRREDAIKRADDAIRALGGNGVETGPKAADRVRDAIENIERVTRIPTPGSSKP